MRFMFFFDKKVFLLSPHDDDKFPFVMSRDLWEGKIKEMRIWLKMSPPNVTENSFQFHNRIKRTKKNLIFLNCENGKTSVDKSQITDLKIIAILHLVFMLNEKLFENKDCRMQRRKKFNKMSLNSIGFWLRTEQVPFQLNPQQLHWRTIWKEEEKRKQLEEQYGRKI